MAVHLFGFRECRVSSLLVRCWWKHDGNLRVYSDDIEWSESLPWTQNVKRAAQKN